jgi:hypothetical protein
MKTLKIMITVLFIISVFTACTKETSDNQEYADVSKNHFSSQKKPQSYVSPLDQLELAKPDELSPQGEIAEMFSLGSDFTDLQRQLKLKEIRGKVIEWRLPVYEVMQSGDGYTIQTSTYATGDKKYIGTVLRITPRDEIDRRFVERIKTGDFIKVKGVIDDVTMRNLSIRPAIIVDDLKIPKQIIQKAYNKYVSKNDCWLTYATVDEVVQQYCMKLSLVYKTQFRTIDHFHVLTLGRLVDDTGTPGGVYLDKGMVGVFFANIKNGQIEIIASNAKMPMGEYGDTPKKWVFVKLGPDNYWGWQSKDTVCHAGQCSNKYIILAPYENDIKNLAIKYSNDSIFETDMPGFTNVELEIDSSASSTMIYPLLLKVMEEENGQMVNKKTFKIPFDEKKWEWNYVNP